MILGSRAGYNPTEMTKPAQMRQARFRFYAELNDLLSLGRRGRSFVHTFGIPPSLKDVIEAFGVPHTEVGLILANGEAAAFSHLLRDGDKISVYPVFRSLGLTPLVPLQPRPEGEMRFVLDTLLGKLAAHLRMLGFDSLYRNDCPDEELAHISATEQRILLSRDRGVKTQHSDSRLPGACSSASRTAHRSVLSFQPERVHRSVLPVYRVQHLAASRSQGTNQRSPAARDQKTLRRISLLPTVQPSLLEGVALPTHGRSDREYD